MTISRSGFILSGRLDSAPPGADAPLLGDGVHIAASQPAAPPLFIVCSAGELNGGGSIAPLAFMMCCSNIRPSQRLVTTPHSTMRQPTMQVR